MDIFVIIPFILVAAVASVILKNQNKEIGIAFTVIVSAIVLGIIFTQIQPVFEEIYKVSESAGIKNTYILSLIKALGICYITEFATESCKDAGENALSSKAEMCGRIAIITIALPLVKEILEMSVSILEG